MTGGAPQDALPTLLRSRPKAAREPAKVRARPAPAPLALESLEGRPGAASPRLRVKNTFIEGEPQLSPSLGAFYRERAVRTCPSQHVGRLADLACVGEPLAASPCGLHTPCNIQTPACDSVYEYSKIRAAFSLGHLGFPAVAQVQEAMPVPCYPYAGAQLGFVAFAGHPGLDGMAAVRQESYRPRAVLNLSDAIDLNSAGDSDVAAHAAPTLEGARVEDQLKLRSAAVPASLPPPPAAPAPGSAQLPSLGSADHSAGCCKPCAFLHRAQGCENGFACKFCHLCGPEEHKRRKKDKQELLRAMRKAPQQGDAPSRSA